ncbi:MAG: hypothetical protein KF819_16540 [Labilithrix sp.]|nr:hypothetical protein [Labilithrix sp.]
MSRGVGEIEGWSAVAWVAGMGAGVLVAAGILWMLARGASDRPPEAPTYRTAGSPGSRRRSHLRGLAIVVLVVGLLSQLSYAGLYVELVRAAFGAPVRPSISGDLFFWVFLVDATVAGGALASGWRSTD